MKHDSGPMPDHLSCLVKMIIWSTPVKDPHMKQRQQRRIVDLPPVNHMKPFSPADHMGPQSIVKEEVRKDIVPPLMVCHHLVLPLLADSMEGILGNLENPPQCFFNQKQRGRLPHVLLDSVPIQTMGYEPSRWNTWSSQEANLWLAWWSVESHPLQRWLTWWWDVGIET